MGRPTKTQAVLIKELQERQDVLEAKLSKVRTRKHHELAKIISQLLSDVKAMKEQISRLDEKDAVSPILIGQIESLKNADEVLNQRITVLEEGQIKLAELTATTARTVKEHGDVLDTHSGRIGGLEAAVAHAQAQINALRNGGAFNWIAAVITAAIGLGVYFFWFISHDFSGAVLNAQHEATGMTARSLLNTGWADAMALGVIALLSYGIGTLLSRQTEPVHEVSASASAMAVTTEIPVTRTTSVATSSPSGPTAPSGVR
jgi:hypothetical protein